MTTPRPDSKTAVEGTTAPALNTAVIVASGPLFDAGPAVHPTSADPHPVTALTRVGGLSLFQRTVLTLQRAGISRLLILADEDEPALRACLSEDSRITALVRWIPVREFPPQDVRTWEALAEDIQGICLVVSVHAVFSRSLVEHLCREVPDDRALLVVTYPLENKAGPEAWADMLALPVNVLRSSGTLLAAGTDENPLRGIVNRASTGGRLRTISTSHGSSNWYRPVRNDEEAKAAERCLFQSLKSDLDGLVDTYFNRPVSRVLTRMFLFLGWSPNAITVLSILIGLAAALSFSLGTYIAGVIGALLFQASTIIDCCDGDVARLTFKESRFGGQLDLYGDNAVHMAMLAAMAWGPYADTQALLPLAVGAAAILGSALSLWFVTRLKARTPPAVTSHPAQRTRSEFIINHLANRDFSVAVLFFALLNGLGMFLWLAAIGSNVFWVYTAWAIRSRAEC